VLVSILANIFIVFGALALFGRITLSLFDRKNYWSFADFMSTGLVITCIVFIICISVGLTESATTLSIILIAIFLILTEIFLSFFSKTKKILQTRSEVLLPKVFLFLTIVIATGFSILSHPLGYDDTAHLDYLLNVHDQSPFPVFRPLIGNWEIARYPLFGLLISGLGSITVGGEIYLYYLISISVFACLILKIFEIFKSSGGTTRQSLGISLLVFSVLAIGFADYDSFLTFANYPFQSSRLIIILGGLYLFFDWFRNGRRLAIAVGVGLLWVGSLWHPNSVPIALLYFLALTVLVIIRSPYRKKFSLAISAIATLAFLTFIVLSSEPIIRANPDSTHRVVIDSIEKPRASISVNTQPTKFLNSGFSFWESITNAFNQRFETRSWPLTTYLKRIGLLSFVVPLWIFIAIKYKWLVKGGFFITISLITVTSQLLLTVPKQAMGSIIKSGTVPILLDLHPFFTSKDPESTVVTDSYSALYLKLLGFENILDIEYGTQFGLFSPISSPKTRENITSLLQNPEDINFIVNTRLWRDPQLGEWPFSNWRNSRQSLLGDVQDYRGVTDIQTYFANGLRGLITPVYSPTILVNYLEVLNRPFQKSRSHLPFKIIYKDVLKFSLPKSAKSNWYEIKISGESADIGLINILDHNGLQLIRPSDECESNTNTNHIFAVINESACQDWIWLVSKNEKGSPQYLRFMKSEFRDLTNSRILRVFVPAHTVPVTFLVQIKNGRLDGLGEINKANVVLIQCELHLNHNSAESPDLAHRSSCNNESDQFLYLGPSTDL
jgi:hypothetical protein